MQSKLCRLNRVFCPSSTVCRFFSVDALNKNVSAYDVIKLDMRQRGRKNRSIEGDKNALPLTTKANAEDNDGGHICKEVKKSVS